jgi:hypothetical protein
MPETEAPAPTTEEAPAPSAPDAPEGDGEKTDGNEWLRETAQGLIYSRPLDTAKQSDEWAEANAELRRGRKNGQAREGKQEETRPAEEAADEAPPEGEQKASGETDAEFDRKVQAEVDRREAVRRQRAESQQEARLRRENPQEYARLKEQQEQQNTAAGALTNALRGISNQFDDAAVKPLMDELDEKTRNSILGKASGVHGIPQRKLLVTEGIAALKKAAYEEGLNKGREEARRSLRRNPSFRKELLSELRGEEEEPDLALGNGASRDTDWDMNSWMRSMTGRGSGGRSRASSRE